MGKLQITLPPYKIEEVFQSFSEVYDWGLRDLQIPEIHKETQGEGVTIAIIDSGKTTHFENTHNAGTVKNFSPSSVSEDRLGHSTFISGLIGADINDQGIIGVAPKVQLIFAKAMNDSGTGDPASLTNAINWAIDQKADIISISAGLFSDFKPMHEAVKKAYKQNIIIVAACGNSGSRYYDVAFPARYEEVIGIAAYNEAHKTAPFSSRGVNVKFALPGVDIYSTWLNNGFCRSSGTSFSCPFMAGICALILSKHRKNGGNTPCTTPKEMLQHLEKYSVTLGPKQETGYGTVNLAKLFADGV